MLILEALWAFFFGWLDKAGIIYLIDRTLFGAGGAARSKHGALPVLSLSEVDPSYLLFSLFNSGEYPGETGTVYLTDLYGQELHSWTTPHQTMVAYLLPNADLIYAGVLKTDKTTSQFPGGGRTGIVQRLDWSGKVLWEYRNEGMHHDFEMLPNGNVIVTVWKKVSPLVARKIKKGGEQFELWADALLEINPQGEVVWEWNVEEHLDPTTSLLDQYEHRVEWTHTNSVRYVPNDPIRGEEALLLSMRNTNLVLLISKKTGEVTWTSPRGLFGAQHDATLMESGTILLFDNGLHPRLKSRSEVVASRVIEIDPKANAITWNIEGGRASSERARFFQSIMCGAQRLRNGNTHVTISSSGHFFEVSPQGKVVWDFVSPFTTYGDGLWAHNAVFNTQRYRVDEIVWPYTLPPPLPAWPPYSALRRQKAKR